jgi:hypothetical protein
MLTGGQIRSMSAGKSAQLKPHQFTADAPHTLMLMPSTAKRIGKAINRMKGVRLALKGDETAVDTMTGEGIFGKQFDRFVKKTIGKKATKSLYGVADKVLKPRVNKGLDAASMAAMAYAPAAAPAIMAAKRVAKGYLDRPSAYQANPSKEMMKDADLASVGMEIAKEQMKGQGIFGKQFDRFVKKTIGKKATKTIYKALDKSAKPLVNKGLDLAEKAALAYAPEAAPAIAAAKRVAKGYVDDPSGYQKDPTGRAMKDADLAKVAMDVAKEQMKGGRVRSMGGALAGFSPSLRMARRRLRLSGAGFGPAGSGVSVAPDEQTLSPFARLSSPQMNPFIAPAKYQSFNRIDGKGFGPAGSGFKPAGSGMMGCVNASCRSGMGMYGLPM